MLPRRIRRQPRVPPKLRVPLDEPIDTAAPGTADHFPAAIAASPRRLPRPAPPSQAPARVNLRPLPRARTALLGNDPLFQVPQYQLVHPGELGIYAILGVAGGFVSVGFTKLLLWMRARFLRFPTKTVWFQPVAGGPVVGGMGLVVAPILWVWGKHGGVG